MQRCTSAARYQYQEGGMGMLDFEEELKHFQPSLEVGQVEDAIGREDLTDMTDLMMELLKGSRE